MNSTPLHYAAGNGHLSIVEYLVNQKADINEKNDDDWTPLHKAARFGHLSVVEYLVNQKADLNTKDYMFAFIYFILLLFFMLLKMAILVLSNTYFIEELIFEIELKAKVIFIGLLKKVILVLLNI